MGRQGGSPGRVARVGRQGGSPGWVGGPRPTPDKRQTDRQTDTVPQLNPLSQRTQGSNSAARAPPHSGICSYICICSTLIQLNHTIIFRRVITRATPPVFNTTEVSVVYKERRWLATESGGHLSSAAPPVCLPFVGTPAPLISLEPQIDTAVVRRWRWRTRPRRVNWRECASKRQAP